MKWYLSKLENVYVCLSYRYKQTVSVIFLLNIVLSLVGILPFGEIYTHMMWCISLGFLIIWEKVSIYTDSIKGVSEELVTTYTKMTVYLIGLELQNDIVVSHHNTQVLKKITNLKYINKFKSHYLYEIFTKFENQPGERKLELIDEFYLDIFGIELRVKQKAQDETFS